jgi:hypothetical protein
MLWDVAAALRKHGTYLKKFSPRNIINLMTAIGQALTTKNFYTNNHILQKAEISLRLLNVFFMILGTDNITRKQYVLVKT